MNRVTCHMAAVLLLLAATAAVQTNAANWNTVKALTTGIDVRIVSGSRTVSGKLQGVRDESISVNSGNAQAMFSQLQVDRVSIKRTDHRRRNTLIGLGTGAALGLIAGSITDSKCAGGSCLVGANFGKAVLTSAGAVLGIGVGWLGLPAGGSESIRTNGA